jgi:ATP-dependent Clp protease ATP-binding subunit ClpA
MHRAKINPPNRPVGNFMLIGPTGVGKTKTVEVLARVLHGSEKNILIINCGEYQSDHEVAKLIGAPPGYLGHRETQAAITTTKLNAMASENSDLSVVLFDEVEKASDALQKLLLGVLDKGILRLGDSSTVLFYDSVIFLTSNVGSVEMNKCLKSSYGFEKAKLVDINSVAKRALKKKFSPEFLNRIDEILQFDVLSDEAISNIFDLEVEYIAIHLKEKYNVNFELIIDEIAKVALLKEGFSIENGARELKRVLCKRILFPITEYILDDINGNPCFAVCVEDGNVIIERNKIKTAAL